MTLSPNPNPSPSPNPNPNPNPDPDPSPNPNPNLGSVLRAAGIPMRTPRVGGRGGVLSLVAAARDVQLLRHTPQPDSVPLAPHVPPPPPRFHITPNTVRWHRALGLLNVGAHNTLDSNP